MTLFNSHIKTLRIVLTPSRPIYEQGVRLGDTQGKYIQFENSRFQTDDKEIIEKLEKLPTFGVDFWRVSGESTQATPKNESPQKIESDLESLTKAELLALAKEKKIEVDEGLTKSEIIERLKTQ
jgi:hypothetical protein